jgi:hypothetical protein
VPVAPGPIGRYGHAACMNETRFFVFGGQAEGAFMNDLWAYDIRQCKQIPLNEVFADPAQCQERNTLGS